MGLLWFLSQTATQCLSLPAGGNTAGSGPLETSIGTKCERDSADLLAGWGFPLKFLLIVVEIFLSVDISLLIQPLPVVAPLPAILGMRVTPPPQNSSDLDDQCISHAWWMLLRLRAQLSLTL